MEIKVPAVGESIVEALVAKWEKKNGDLVVRDEIICELETDKITLPLHAETSGRLSIVVEAGNMVNIGAVIGRIDQLEAVNAVDNRLPKEAAIQATSPAARKIAAESGIDIITVTGSGKGGRVLAQDMNKMKSSSKSQPESDPEKLSAALLVHSEENEPYFAQAINTTGSGSRRIPMSPIRKRIAQRLLAARQETAMLTTFNEADMSRIKELRNKFGEHYQNKFGIKPGLMPFFIKACCEALREFPEINASIDGDDIIYHDYFDIGIAIGGEKGLVVPVLRGADRLRFTELDLGITELVRKVKENRLGLADLEGGTFTITNGGVYGSLLSTPIINPPQSAVLGMHAIQERPVALDGQVIIRPMMYLALSYDHRLIDGRGAVQFLKRVKELVEEPEELLLEG